MLETRNLKLETRINGRYDGIVSTWYRRGTTTRGKNSAWWVTISPWIRHLPHLPLPSYIVIIEESLSDDHMTFLWFVRLRTVLRPPGCFSAAYTCFSASITSQWMSWVTTWRSPFEQPSSGPSPITVHVGSTQFREACRSLVCV